ncbi:hypothetical protein AAXE64_08310 [Priestia megaterium]
MTQTIQLQSVGRVAAVEASELKAGDVRAYNFGSTGLVVKVIEKSAKTLSVITYENGKYYISDIRKTTLVAIAKRDQDVSMHMPQEAAGRKGMVDVSEYFQVEEAVEVTEEIKTTEKIAVKSITITATEAGKEFDGLVLNSFFDAQIAVMRMSSEATNYYNKTWFTVEWTDGRTHEGRIDIEAKDGMKTNAIGEHVRGFYEYLAGENKPSSWTEEEYRNNLKHIYKMDEEKTDEIKEILNTYMLEDIKEEVSQTVENDSVIDEVEVVEVAIEKTEEVQDIGYKLNEEKQGIELYFNSKPAQETIETLKANKFRWSRRGFWYAKQSDSTIELAEKLTNQKETVKVVNEPVSYPEVEINDNENYTIDQSLQDREHDSNWLFRTKKINHNEVLQQTFKEYTGKVKEIVDTTDNGYIVYKLKSSLQRFKKKYHDNYIKCLSNKASQPHWAVSGRGNLNSSKYNKTVSSYDRLLSESVEIVNDMDKAIQKAKRDIKKLEKETVKKAVSNVSIDEYTFRTITKSTETHEKIRMYELDGYYIAKTWGTFRIYFNNKEVHAMKTNETLKDAKQYVIYLLQKEKDAVTA